MRPGQAKKRSMTTASLAVMLGAVAGCGGASAADPMSTDMSCEFRAYSPDFVNFRAWDAFHLPDALELGVVHLAGPKTDYLNERPPPGSTEFPKGTIIVKEVEVGAIPDRQVFALVKRGCNYDAAGAPGWEWFELTNDATGNEPTIRWRGFGPPLGMDIYGGDPNACIDCHAGAKSNDYVQSPPLQLPNF
jgi:hypothetical protein